MNFRRALHPGMGLRTTMQASDVMETLDLARARTGVDQVRVRHHPRQPR